MILAGLPEFADLLWGWYNIGSSWFCGFGLGFGCCRLGVVWVVLAVVSAGVFGFW